MKKIAEVLKDLRTAIVHEQQVAILRQYGEGVKGEMLEKIAELEIDPMGNYPNNEYRKHYNGAIADAREVVKNVKIE